MKTFLTFSLFVSFAPAYTQLPGDTSTSKNYGVAENEMREFIMDRPDATESPYTVDAGHFQFETDLFKSESSLVDGVKTVTRYYNLANFKLGITRALDIQLVARSFYKSTVSHGNSSIKESGFGGLTFRAKQNLWGNDAGKTALAILPFVNLPTASGEKISGGLVLPFALSPGGKWGFGAQLESDLVQDVIGNGYHINYAASATASHPFFKNVDFFIETIVAKDNEAGFYEYFLDGGIVYVLAKNIRVDCGVYYGVKSISATTYFLGFSFRL